MVSINPSHASDDGGLLDMSTEEVIAVFIEREKRRHADGHEDETQKEVRIAARGAPVGLLYLLDDIAHNIGVSRAIITRCLSHRVAAWFDTISSIRDLVTDYYEAHRKALKHGHAEVIHRHRFMSYYKFQDLSEGYAGFYTIGWVRSKLYDISVPLGVPTFPLFAIGLCESLSATTSEDYIGTTDPLKKEVGLFLQHIGQRGIEISMLLRSVEYRAGVSGGVSQGVSRGVSGDVQ